MDNNEIQREGNEEGQGALWGTGAEAGRKIELENRAEKKWRWRRGRRRRGEIMHT